MLEHSLHFGGTRGNKIMISDYLLSFFSNLAGKNWISYLTVTQSKFRLRAQILQTKDFISYELQNVLVFVLETIGCIVKL